MLRPAMQTLTAARNRDFVHELHFTEGGLPFDFTGYSGDLEVRLYGGQPGAPKISLGNVTSDAEGVWIIEPSAGVIQLRIDWSTLRGVYESLFAANEAGTPISLVYDLRLTAPDGIREVWLAGEFILYPGVTIGA